MAHFYLEVQSDKLLGRVGVEWEFVVHMAFLDRLWQTHQGGHLPIENVNGPPDIASSLDHILSKGFDRHVCVHALGQGDPRSLANLQNVSQ